MPEPESFSEPILNPKEETVVPENVEQKDPAALTELPENQEIAKVDENVEEVDEEEAEEPPCESKE